METVWIINRPKVLVMVIHSFIQSHDSCSCSPERITAGHGLDGPKGLALRSSTPSALLAASQHTASPVLYWSAREVQLRQKWPDERMVDGRTDGRTFYKGMRRLQAG